MEVTFEFLQIIPNHHQEEFWKFGIFDV